MRLRSAKMWRRMCDVAKEQYCHRSFALATSNSRLRLRFFHCIQQVSVDDIEFDTGTILAQGLPIKLRYYWYACAGPSCLLWMYINILMCTFTMYVYQCWLCLIIVFSTYNVMSAILWTHALRDSCYLPDVCLPWFKHSDILISLRNIPCSFMELEGERGSGPSPGKFNFINFTQ